MVEGSAQTPMSVRGSIRLHRAPWRVTVARVVVNALSVALVVRILPGVYEYARHPVLGYLLLGALFGVLNAFVKPVMQFVAFPLLLGSMGLVVIAIDVLLFWLLEHLTPLIRASGIGWVVVAGTLLGVLSGVLDNLLGLVPPIQSDRNDRRASP
jgi:putative membrane protein